MDNCLSKKINLLSFVAMIMVLFIHSFNITLYNSSKAEATVFYTQDFISFHLCRVAVPSFFIISAYFLSSNYDLTWQAYYGKLKSRFKSLAIPYLLWAGLWSAFFIFISSIPQLRQFINNPLGDDKDSNSSLIYIFNNPICYQFWFVRDLFFLVVFSPVLLFLVQRSGLLIVAISFLNFTFSVIEIPFFQNISLFYFVMGMAIYCDKIKFITLFLSTNVWILGTLWAASYFIPKITVFGCHDIELFAPFSTLIGIVFIWKFYDKANKENTLFNQLEKHSKFSFFLFATHEPLMISLKKISFAVFGLSGGIRLAAYFALPVIVYCLCIFSGYSINKYFPKTYKILTGGR